MGAASGDNMPIVAVVDGVKIAFYANERPPAHFHVMIAEHRAVFDIAAAIAHEKVEPVT